MKPAANGIFRTLGRRTSWLQTKEFGATASARKRIAFLTNFFPRWRRISGSTETQVTAGYNINIVGFGWTNGVFLSLLHELPGTSVTRLANEQSAEPGL